jgi:DNA-binding NarL/FixJ family response regulator
VACKIRVMIVADHPIMLEGLRITLRKQKDMQIVCEAIDTAAVLRDFAVCAPDVTIIDLQRPPGEGWRAVKTLRMKFPSCAIVVLTTYPGEAAGVGNGVLPTLELPKTASGVEVIAAVRRAAQLNRP